MMNVNRWLWWVCDDFESQQVIVKFVPHPFQRLVDKFCDERCHLSLVTDLNMMPSTEKIIRKASTEWQAGNWFCKDAHFFKSFVNKSYQSLSLIRLPVMTSTSSPMLISQSSVLWTNKTSINMRVGCRACWTKTPCVLWSPKIWNFSQVSFL